MTLILKKPTGAKLAFRKDSVAATDINIREVSLLLHGNGTNGSTTITDSSLSPKTVTAFGDAKISTAQSKFGGASIAFDGTGDYLKVSHSDLALSSENFTIEFWLRRVNTTTTENIIDYRTASLPNEALLYLTTGGLAVTYYAGGADRIVGASLSQSTWYHIALCRAAGSTRLFIGGNQSGSTYADSNTFTSTALTIGGRYEAIGGNFREINGYIDDLRITKGVARYTANFTPPTAAFPDF